MRLSRAVPLFPFHALPTLGSYTSRTSHRTLGAGLLIIGLGLTRRKRGKRRWIRVKPGSIVGKSDSAFSGYFTPGGPVALAGVVLLVTGRRG
ncbi:MAG TPA: hypothetical protein PK760_14815, partial [Flavobacteriales bacterium]|nr:hypothetical protein [Flavobacteriales bacterium]